MLNSHTAIAVPPQARKRGLYPKFRNPPISLQLSPSGDANGNPPGRHHTPTVSKPQPYLLIADKLRFRESTVPGEDRVPSLDQEDLHTCSTPTTRWQEQISPVDSAPQGGEAHPHPLIVGWLLVGAHGASELRW